MRLIWGAAAVVGMAAMGRAELIIDVQDAIIGVDSTTSVDVRIASTSTDLLDSYLYRFQITSAATNVGELIFAAQADDEALEPDYVFGLGSVGPASLAENEPAFDRVSGTDQSLFGPVSLDTTDLLLARLELEHILPDGVDPNLAAGDQFTISLLEADTTLLSDPFDPPSFVAFTSSSGLITTQVASVPEASSAGLLAISLVALVLYRRRRSRVIAQPAADG